MRARRDSLAVIHKHDPEADNDRTAILLTVPSKNNERNISPFLSLFLSSRAKID